MQIYCCFVQIVFIPRFTIYRQNLSNMILFIEFVYLKSLYLQAKFKLKKPEVEKQKAMCLNHPFLLSGSENTDNMYKKSVQYKL